MEESSLIHTILSESSLTEDLFISLLNDISREDCLIDILEDIFKSSSLLELIASRSYDHSNGFYKIVLYSSEKCKLRLHIWYPSKINSATENVHYHRWRFTSKILIGEYEVFDYELNSEGTPMNSYYYFPRSGKDEYSLVRVGIDNVTLVNTRILTRNSFLVSLPKELHRVIPNRNIYTASLLIQGPDELGHSMVYNESSIAEAIVSPRLTQKELIKILMDFKIQLLKPNDQYTN